MSIELYFEKGNPSKFTSLVRELDGPGILTQNKVSYLLHYLYISLC